MSKVYWAIKGKDGKLILHYNTGLPCIFHSAQEAKLACIRKGERPVRVEIREVEE